MANNLEPIEVLRGHLVELHRALDAAAGYHAARDLAKAYEAMGSATRSSNLTKALEKGRDRIAYYLGEGEDEPT